MAVDPGVLGVIGGWSTEAARAASPEYERLGLVFLSPGVDFVESMPLAEADEGFGLAYQELSGGVPPGQAAAWAYAAAGHLLASLETAAEAEGVPSRAQVRTILVSE
jgi:ABC-type branched-subunit amino acid transport system substrate-binding protein